MKWIKMAKEREAGYTLIVVVGTFVVLSILGLSIAVIVNQSVQSSAKDRDQQSAYYIAESAAQMQLEEVEKQLYDIYEDIANNENAPLEQLENEFYSKVQSELICHECHYDETYFEVSDKAEAYVNIELIDAEETVFSLLSLGELDGEKRSVESTFKIEWNEELIHGYIPPFAMLMRGKLTIDQGSKLTGDIGSFGQQLNEAFNDVSTIDPPYIDFPNKADTDYNDKIFVHDPEDDQLVNTSGIKPESEYSIEKLDKFPFPILPEPVDIPEALPTLPDTDNESFSIKNGVVTTKEDHAITEQTTMLVDQDLYFKEINIPGVGMILRLDLQGEDRTIVVDDFNVNGGVIFLTEGEGKLTLIVKNNLNLQGTFMINHFENTYINDSEKTEEQVDISSLINNLNIYYFGNQDKVEMSGDSKIYGSIYLVDENTDLILNNGSGGIYGNVLMTGKNFVFGSGSGVTNQLIIAPNADVIFKESKIKGSIIANSLEMKNGAELEYLPPEEIPVTGPLSYESILEYNINENIEIFIETPLFNVEPLKESR